MKHLLNNSRTHCLKCGLSVRQIQSGLEYHECIAAQIIIHDDTGDWVYEEGMTIKPVIAADDVLDTKEWAAKFRDNKDQILGMSKDALRTVTNRALEEAVLHQPPGPTLKCPSCSAKLVVREGQYGKFLGCTAFPACRYTQGISSSVDPPANI